jgi:hypothetical protein
VQMCRRLLLLVAFIALVYPAPRSRAGVNRNLLFTAYLDTPIQFPGDETPVEQLGGYTVNVSSHGVTIRNIIVSCGGLVALGRMSAGWRGAIGFTLAGLLYYGYRYLSASALYLQVTQRFPRETLKVLPLGLEMIDESSFTKVRLIQRLMGGYTPRLRDTGIIISDFVLILRGALVVGNETGRMKYCLREISIKDTSTSQGQTYPLTDFE